MSNKMFQFHATLVIWNPWQTKAKAMADFGDEEYKLMICVEAGSVQERRLLNSRQLITMSQDIIVKSFD